MTFVIPTLESSPAFDAQTIPDTTDWQALAITPILTPTLVSATGGVNEVALVWTALAGATSYNILRTALNGASGTESTLATGVTTLSYVDATVASGTYYYKVQSVVGVITSAPSNELQATPT